MTKKQQQTFRFDRENNTLMLRYCVIFKLRLIWEYLACTIFSFARLVHSSIVLLFVRFVLVSVIVLILFLSLYCVLFHDFCNIQRTCPTLVTPCSLPAWVAVTRSSHVITGRIIQAFTDLPAAKTVRTRRTFWQHKQMQQVTSLLFPHITVLHLHYPG